MGYDLRNAAMESFNWNLSDWPRLLKLAHNYGWEPEHKKVDLYYTNDGVMVSDQDAANLADALEKLLHDLSNKSLNKYVKIGGLTMAYKEENIEPMKHFSGRFYKKIIKDFIHFCRQGKFVIR